MVNIYLRITAWIIREQEQIIDNVKPLLLLPHNKIGKEGTVQAINLH
jgi:hypothetical protein